MYEIEDRGAAIAEVQRLLDLNQTRVFDKKTINSVAEHQKSQNLEVTGIVDYATFLSLVASKKSRENNKRHPESEVSFIDAGKLRSSL